MLGQKETTNLQQEVFILPYGLKEVARLDNSPLYGSDKLNEKFLLALAKQDKTNSSIKTIERLIKKKLIVPCFLEKGLLHHIGWRIFGPAAVKSIAGFFNPGDGRVFILISNDANLFTYVSNEFLANLTCHELSHRAAFEDTNKFYQTFRNELITFYRVMFSEIFKIDEKKLDDKTVFSFIKFLFQYIEMSVGSVSSSALIKYSTMLRMQLQGLSSLKHDDFLITSDDYIQIIGIFLKDINLFFDSIGEFSHILSPIYRAYKKALDVRNASTVCIQELIYPSEVIALLSEYGPDAIAKKILAVS
jgi:uncharacterized LabA/DUF88 family protein